MEWLPQPAGPRAWQALGQVAAELNAITQYPEPFAVPVDAAVAALAERCSGETFEAEVRRLLPRLAELGRPRRRGLIHGEVNLANARLRGDGTVALVDWDQAGAGPLALEYGYPLIAQFISASTLDFDGAASTDFYRGYAAGGGTVDADLIFTAALFHALRYMWFADTDARWRRIVWALEREGELVDAVMAAST